MGRPEDFIYRCNMLGLAIITGVCVKRMFTLRDFFKYLIDGWLMIDAFTDITYRYARAYMHIHIHIHIYI